MNNNLHPNLFLAGAPKCGTTSVSSWLSQHPDVFLPKEKEPSHFYHPNQYPMPLDAYLSLYKNAGKMKYRLDGSIWYMFSRQAIKNIDRAYPDSRFVICLRDPVDMFFSLHQQKIYSGQELLRDPMEAWKAGGRRARGEPFGIRNFSGLDPSHMAYSRACALGTQVGMLLDTISISRVHFILFDDLSNRPSRVFEDLCRWLNLDIVEGIDFAIRNPAKVARSEALNTAMLFMSKFKRRLLGGMGSGLFGALHRLNSRECGRDEVSEEFIRNLRNYFCHEVKHLEKLLDCDLSMWMRR